MALKDRINEDMKNYMKEKNQLALGAIRMIKADIKNAEIAKIGELSDEEIVKVIQSSIKKRKDSIEQFKNAGRDDLVEKETAELKYLEVYLPKGLTKEEVVAIIKEEAARLDLSDKKNFGVLMKTVMGRVQGRYDGREVSAIVNEVTAGNL
ncbi:MAG: GatB/YqeY domain-containing protein [Calditerrivibrio sp.]|nr:GatB/YqeY domain-containing protein [Calditerrivibrio sp.]MCA1932743.1 GatB/YqeY domain-containing protein [Calditerrivibrio sp.]MCA1979915.1 GatB/YqeY domain-containing protein [Calditerrivibrio sp.]